MRKNFQTQRVELHCYTTMSIMKAVATPGSIVRNAAYLGQKTVAITDLNSVQGFREAQKVGKEFGVKVIYGVDICIIDDLENPIDSENKSSVLGRHKYYASILAKNAKGLKNLYKLVSMAHTTYLSGSPILPKSVLNLYRNGLLVGTSYDVGEVYCSVQNGDSDERLRKLHIFMTILNCSRSPTKEI